MIFGVRRRGVLLLPPTPADFEWVLRSFDAPELVEALDLDPRGSPDARGVEGDPASGGLVVGIIHRMGSSLRLRVGFAMFMKPNEGQPLWEFAYAIPERRHRDAFTAIHTIDAMSWYAFDHLGVPGVLFRMASDNRASQAVVRRMGYPPFRTDVDDRGRSMTVSWVSRARWVRRRDRLRAEDPSALVAVDPEAAGGAWAPERARAAAIG